MPSTKESFLLPELVPVLSVTITQITGLFGAVALRLRLVPKSQTNGKVAAPEALLYGERGTNDPDSPPALFKPLILVNVYLYIQMTRMSTSAYTDCSTHRVSTNPYAIKCIPARACKRYPQPKWGKRERKTSSKYND